MSSRDDGTRRGVAVPSGKLTRFARFGGMAGSVAGGVAFDAAREFARGGRPRLGDLLLTPANAQRVTRELARLRGAAMKVGQLLSMDAGELLPAELSDILARLRSDAEPMPPKQLRAVLDRQWGKGWLARFERFDVRPIAAASIGQVHRAQTRDGRDLAIKVQYPGVRRSIDSDVDNVATLLRLSGALPDGLDVATLLGEAKRQLNEEADYGREGAQLTRYAALLEGDDRFATPTLAEDFTTADVLAMSYVDARPIETLFEAPQEQRDAAAAALLELALRELLEFRLMQTDPNFANYRYDPESGRIALLDFGATREIPEAVSEDYRRLIRTALEGDLPAVRQGMLDIGFFDDRGLARHEGVIMGIVADALPLLDAGPYDFGDRTLARRLRDEGVALATDREFWHIPPADALFIQRKATGMFLLASRLRARVDVGALLRRLA